MRVPRELILLVGIFGILAVAAAGLQPASQTERAPDLSSHSAEPGGTLALYLWLQSLGYQVERLEYRTFDLDPGASALLVMAPSVAPDAEELTTLYDWVDEGGTLVLVGSYALDVRSLPLGSRLPGSPLAATMEKFDLAQHMLISPEREAVPSQPLLLKPPVSSVRVDAVSYVTGTAKLVPYLGQSGRPIAAGLRVGRGKVFALASGRALSNQGLGEADNAALLLNWLPAPGEGGTILFDEVHHGLVEERSLARLMVHEPWGWAVLYALGAIFLYLALGGRRFGRAVVAAVDGRRAGAEYVISLAGLLRRGRKRDWVARHYERALRRKLSEAFDLDPALPPGAVAERLAGIGTGTSGVDGGTVGGLLAALRAAQNPGTSEARLVQLAAEADRIIKACSGRRQ